MFSFFPRFILGGKHFFVFFPTSVGFPALISKNTSPWSRATKNKAISVKLMLVKLYSEAFLAGLLTVRIQEADGNVRPLSVTLELL